MIESEQVGCTSCNAVVDADDIGTCVSCREALCGQCAGRWTKAGEICETCDFRASVTPERLPRVTAADFETLASVAEKIAVSKTATNALRAELGLEAKE